jgi:hypothetical protein
MRPRHGRVPTPRRAWNCWSPWKNGGRGWKPHCLGCGEPWGEVECWSTLIQVAATNKPSGLQLHTLMGGLVLLRSVEICGNSFQNSIHVATSPRGNSPRLQVLGYRLRASDWRWPCPAFPNQRTTVARKTAGRTHRLGDGQMAMGDLMRYG